MSGVIDVGVVGAGPAGLAAALAAGDLGCEVTLIDAGPGPGGQRYHQSLLFPGAARGAAAGAAEHLPPGLARIRQVREVRHLAATTVGQATRGHDGVVTLWVGGPEGGAETTVEVRAVVLATGSTEIVLPFPGWDLPGVTTTGAARALLEGQGVTMGRRTLVAGSGPRLLPVAATLAEAGVEVVAVLEAGRPEEARLAAFPGDPRVTGGYVATLARHGVPVRTGCAVVACQGTDRVERAVMARLDEGWRPIPGSQREEFVDAVHVSFGFSPALELPRALGCATGPDPSGPTAAVTCDADLATSVPGVFAAGEVTGVSGADRVELQGYLAGASAARYLGRLNPVEYGARTQPLRARLEDVRLLATGVDEACPLRPGWLEWPDAGTVVCRCQETSWSEIGAAVAGGAQDVPTVKEITGCGTGYCRGRVCGPALRYAVSAAARGPGSG
jgi:NADPH-dependent 2,4-dienoyl-CoA reductase/sulfur reductase-like enzyme/bacterioferritin-associated ferredoxin